MRRYIEGGTNEQENNTDKNNIMYNGEKKGRCKDEQQRKR